MVTCVGIDMKTNKILSGSHMLGLFWEKLCGIDNLPCRIDSTEFPKLLQQNS